MTKHNIEITPIKCGLLRGILERHFEEFKHMPSYAELVIDLNNIAESYYEQMRKNND